MRGMGYTRSPCTIFATLWIYYNFKIKRCSWKLIYDSSQWWEPRPDWVGFEVLGWERSKHTFLVCGERARGTKIDLVSFSCDSGHFFPLGGRKCLAGCKDLKAEDSNDCSYCNIWTLGGGPPTPPWSCSFSRMWLAPQNYDTPEIDLCWSLASL